MQRKYTSLPYKEYPVATGHFDTNRAPITMIVLHSSACDKQGLINTFGGGTRMVSAHYGIDNDGSILAFLEEYNTAYHAGNYAVNEKSIGIEHIDNGATVKLHTDAQYTTSSKLVADICTFYNIPIDSVHIVPHSAIVATACPNGLDVNRIIEGAKALTIPTQSIITDQTLLPIIDANGNNMEVQAVRSKLAEQEARITDLLTRSDNQVKEIADLKVSLTALNAKITALQTNPTIPPILQNIHDIVWAKGWPWTKISQLRALLPK